MPRKKSKSRKPAPQKSGRRVFTQEFKEEAVQMLLDGHTASSVSKNLGIDNTNLLYRWKQEQLAQSGPVASTLEVRVRELETELRRVERERDVLKKSVSYFRPQRVTEVYAAMESIAPSTASVNELCRILDVSRSASYAWQQAELTTREENDQELLPLVRMIFQKHRRRYGARRIAEELHDLGHVCGRHRVSKLLKSQGLRAIQPKSFKPRTTESRHRLGYSPNLLLESDEPTSINQLWVGDITYVPLVGGVFSYLATLMDRFSRRVVGWELGEDMTEALVLAALTKAIRSRSPGPQLIHHTDRGGQYAGGEYRAILRRAEMRQSMSRAGDCYDNAFMESCFGTIKTELEMTEYENHRAALDEIKPYLAYYNLERKHSALGYLTPTQFEYLYQPPN